MKIYLVKLLVLSRLPVEPKEVFSIFRKTEEGAKLRDSFNKANEKGISEQIFEKISEKYIKK